MAWRARSGCRGGSRTGTGRSWPRGRRCRGRRSSRRAAEPCASPSPPDGARRRRSPGFAPPLPGSGRSLVASGWLPNELGERWPSSAVEESRQVSAIGAEQRVEQGLDVADARANQRVRFQWQARVLTVAGQGGTNGKVLVRLRGLDQLE